MYRGSWTTIEHYRKRRLTNIYQVPSTELQPKNYKPGRLRMTTAVKQESWKMAERQLQRQHATGLVSGN